MPIDGMGPGVPNLDPANMPSPAGEPGQATQGHMKGFTEGYANAMLDQSTYKNLDIEVKYENGEMAYVLSGEVGEIEWEQFEKELQKVGVRYDATAVNLKKSQNASQKAGAELSKPNYAMEADKDFDKNVNGPNGAKHPWLKPNGLAAMMIALQELAKEQSKIKAKSKEVWVANVNAGYELGKEVAKMVLQSALVQADITRVEAEKHGINATAAYSQAITNFAFAAGGLIMMRSAGGAAKNVAGKSASGATVRSSAGATRAGAARNLRVNQNAARSTANASKTTTQTTSTGGLRMNSRGARGGQRANVQAAESRAASSARTNRNLDVKAANSSKAGGAETGAAGMDGYNKVMILNMVSSGFNQLIDAGKEFGLKMQDIKRSGLEEEKGGIDAATELIRAQKEALSKQTDELAKENSAADKLMDDALNNAKKASETSSRFNINPHAA